MGQSSSGSSGTAQTPTIAPSATQTSQQKLAGSTISKLAGPGTSGGKVLSALPVDSETKTRIAGDVFNTFAGPDISAQPDQYNDQPSYATLGSKLFDSKYLKQGSLSATAGTADDYTGS